MHDFDFFRQLVEHISCSLAPATAWQETFAFLAGEMPIHGICLHRFDRSLAAFHLEFIVTAAGYFEPDLLLPMTSEEQGHLIRHEALQHPAVYETDVDSPSEKLNRALEEYIPHHPRSLLVSILGTKQEVFGHLVLLGTGPHCFSETHTRLLSLMQSPVSLAMINILQFRRTRELQERLDQERLRLAGEAQLLRGAQIVGAASGLRGVIQLVRQLSGRDTTTLILGETGTGKELIADAVQTISARKNAPYIKVNCGAIPASLIDSELFGFEKGAFTGATATRRGVFEQADGGTLFLDEVGEMPRQAQVRLLRVLQQGTVERVGGHRSIEVDVRIIAATNRPLDELAASGRYRSDLFFRLNVYPIQVPPLRDRTEDLPLLIRHFIDRIAGQYQLAEGIAMAQESMEKLKAYRWPGNVRELENLVERSLTINPQGPVDLAPLLPAAPKVEAVEESSLEELIDRRIAAALEALPDGRKVEEKEEPQEILPLNEAMSRHIRTAMEACGGVINGPNGAAAVLGLPPTTLRKRMQKLGIAFGRGEVWGG